VAPPGTLRWCALHGVHLSAWWTLSSRFRLGLSRRLHRTHTDQLASPASRFTDASSCTYISVRAQDIKQRRLGFLERTTKGKMVVCPTHCTHRIPSNLCRGTAIRKVRYVGTHYHSIGPAKPQTVSVPKSKAPFSEVVVSIPNFGLAAPTGRPLFRLLCKALGLAKRIVWQCCIVVHKCI